MKIVHVDQDGSLLVHIQRAEFNIAAGVNAAACTEPGDEYPLRPVFRFARQLQITLSALVAELGTGEDSLRHAAKRGSVDDSTVTMECGLTVTITDGGDVDPRTDFYDANFAHMATCGACRKALEERR